MKRRDFLKVAGLAALAAVTALIRRRAWAGGYGGCLPGMYSAHFFD